MRKFDQIGLTKAVLWEEAKGKMRAVVAADGSEIGGDLKGDRYRFEIVSEFVEKFIRDFENEGYHE